MGLCVISDRRGDMSPVHSCGSSVAFDPEESFRPNPKSNAPKGLLGRSTLDTRLPARPSRTVGLGFDNPRARDAVDGESRLSAEKECECDF